MAKLIIQENDRSVVHEILEEEVTFGTKAGVTVRLSDSQAGGEHGQVRVVPGVGYRLVDLESRHGTKVNGAFVNQHLLRHGDVIQIGEARITFSAEGELAPPAAAAVLSAAPAAAPARVAAPDRAAAPPPGSRPERGPRARRYRPPSSTPVIVLGVIVGLLLFGLAAMVAMRPWFSPDKNLTIFYDILELERRAEYEEALARAREADPGGDREYYDKIQAAIQGINGRIHGRKRLSEHDVAFREYAKVESWIQDNRGDVAGAVTRLEDFIQRHAGTFYASQAEQRLNDLFGRSPGRPANPDEPFGGTKIDRAWRIALAKSDRLQRGDRFQEAIDCLWDFWEENEPLAEDHAEWQQRVKGEEEDIAQRAETRWEKLHTTAKSHIDKGEYEKAIRLFREVAENFGMEKYQRLANDELRKLSRD